MVIKQIQVTRPSATCKCMCPCSAGSGRDSRRRSSSPGRQRCHSSSLTIFKPEVIKLLNYTCIWKAVWPVDGRWWATPPFPADVQQSQGWWWALPNKSTCLQNSPPAPSASSMPGIFGCMDTSFGVYRDVPSRIWESSGMCALFKKKKTQQHWKQFRYLAPEAFFVSPNYL